MFEFQSGTGKALVFLTLFLAAGVLFVFTTSTTAALIGTVAVAAVLAILYYSGVRIDARARGGR